VIANDPSKDKPIAKKSDLFEVFHEAEKPPSAFRIGAEAEKVGVFEDGRPVQYEGEVGVLSVLRQLAERHGWTPESETAAGPLIALSRGGASVTLEPGAQLELSGAPLSNVHEVAAELDAHLRELRGITDAHGIAWLGLGFQPFAKREDLAFVPKARYGLMRSYLPTRGGHALDMMLRTCTVQANFDYENETDAIRKLRVGLKLSPLTTAMFANSPWVEGAPYGGATFRGQVWLDVDPDRSGLLPAMWDEGARYEHYVDWALDVPMFLIKRGDRFLANTGQTFRSYWADGFEGERATLADWQLHLNTLFPEVRLKRTLEIRGADMQSEEGCSALAALWTGIFYDETALAAAEELTRDFTHAELSLLRTKLPLTGLRTVFRGKPLAELAAAVLDASRGGLARRRRLDAAGRTEEVFLAGLARLVDQQTTPAERLLEGMAAEKDFTAAVIRRTRLAPQPVTQPVTWES
jgi:glutamate--cysteine ligase